MSFENSFVTVKILIKEQYEFVETGLAYVNDKVQYMQYIFYLHMLGHSEQCSDSIIYLRFFKSK